MSDFDEDFSVFEELKSVIGEEAATRLCRLFGGRDVFIPKEPIEGSWLVEAIGWEKTQALCRHFQAGNSGFNIKNLPMGVDILRRKKGAVIVELSDAGMSVCDIAGSLGVHQRTVRRIIADAKRKGQLAATPLLRNGKDKLAQSTPLLTIRQDRK